MPMVCLVGYTNVGKSTLMNKLSSSNGGSEVLAADMLFATLDPTVRKVQLPASSTVESTTGKLFITALHLLNHVPSRPPPQSLTHPVTHSFSTQSLTYSLILK